MSLLHLLLAEGAPKAANIWNPTVIGVLTIACAIGLFCGSVYLLLGTNLGARLGFLIAFAGLMGFMVLLTTLWWSSGSSGIDPPHGHSPQWSVVETTDALANSKIKDVQTIASKGKKIDVDALTNLKPAVDSAIIPAQSLNGETPPTREFATLGYSQTIDYLADFPNFASYEIGGNPSGFLKLSHKHQYAAVQICTAKKDVTPAACDPLKPVHYVILSHDLGTLRQPVVLSWFVSVLLFALSLLLLHWYEQDERARKKAAAGLAPVPTPNA